MANSLLKIELRWFFFFFETESHTVAQAGVQCNGLLVQSWLTVALASKAQANFPPQLLE